MSLTGECAQSTVEFDSRLGMYLNHHSIGGKHSDFVLDLSKVVAPTAIKDTLFTYVPGIEISLHDFGLPKRNLIVRGNFPSVNEALQEPAVRHDPEETLFVAWRRHSAIDKLEDMPLHPHRNLLLVTHDVEWSDDGPIRNDAFLAAQHAQTVMDGDVALLAMNRHENELRIRLHERLLGSVAYYSVAAEERPESTPHRDVDAWLSGLGIVEAVGLPGRVYDAISALLSQEVRVTMLTEQLNTANGEIDALRKSLTEQTAALAQARKQIRSLLDSALQERPHLEDTPFSMDFTSFKRAAPFMSDPIDRYCQVLGIDAVSYKSLSLEQRRQVVNTQRRLIALLYHPDRETGDEEKFKYKNNAADELVRLIDQSAT